MSSSTRSPDDEIRRLRTRLERERAVRKEAEEISESATRRLYDKQGELELLETVAGAANQAPTVDAAMRVALRQVCRHTGWPVGHVCYLANGRDPGLAPTTIWEMSHPDRFQPFRDTTEATAFPPGVGLPGRVLASGAPAWIIDVTRDPNFPRAAAAREVGLKAAFAFPVLVGEEVVGVLEFFAPEAVEPDRTLLALMAHVGTQLGRVVERKRAEDRLASQALQDSLTGLPNRRRLLADLEGLPTTAAEPAVMLAIFDLDGFKAYNDTFGHPAGDALLTRLAHRLAETVADRGCAYRMGGDEFCLLSPLAEQDPKAIVQAAAEALSEHGEGFSVTASYGWVRLPDEATTTSQALGLADRRMYARKTLGSRASAGRQSTDVLLQVLSERSPDLGTHLDEVTELCRSVARALALPDEEIPPLLQAASLHDVGKAAIPDQVLNKPGPLDDEEWTFMRRHPEIGERILSAAPALVKAAKLVRASHERYDGAGYPDRLAGEDIPLGARIIAVCDAFHAMISERPYHPARTVTEALAELRRCGGTQFDPRVVQAFCDIAAGRWPLTAAATG